MGAMGRVHGKFVTRAIDLKVGVNKQLTTYLITNSLGAISNNSIVVGFLSK